MTMPNPGIGSSAGHPGRDDKEKAPMVFCLLVALAVVAAGVVLLYNGGRAAEMLYAPGDIHREHADASCTDCHQSFRGVNDKSCATSQCHSPEDLKKMEAKPAVVELHQDQRAERCTACHTEHRGLEANLTIEYHRYDRTGKGLSGFAACQDCHLQDGRDAHPDIKDERCDACHTSTSTWEAISFSHRSVADRPCADCHAAPTDRLHKAVGQECDRCHGVRAWRPARFDHNILSPAERDNCSACHRLPRDGFHAGAQGISCRECHTTNRWEPSTFRHPPFEEMWEHLEELYCNDCHPRTFKQWRSCRDCHRRGYRRGIWED